MKLSLTRTDSISETIHTNVLKWLKFAGQCGSVPVHDPCRWGPKGQRDSIPSRASHWWKGGKYYSGRSIIHKNSVKRFLTLFSSFLFGFQWMSGSLIFYVPMSNQQHSAISREGTLLLEQQSALNLADNILYFEFWAEPSIRSFTYNF